MIESYGSAHDDTSSVEDDVELIARRYIRATGGLFRPDFDRRHPTVETWAAASMVIAPYNRLKASWIRY